MGNVSEKELMIRLRKGEQEAFEKIFCDYLKYVKMIVSNESNIFLSVEDREEVVADVFIALWKHRGNIDISRESLKPYITTIAKNVTRNKNKERIRYEMNRRFPEETIILSNPTLAKTIQKDMQKIIFEGLAELSQEDAMCFLKFYYYSMSTVEIAEELCLNESTVKSKLSRGRKKLRHIFEERGIGYESIHF